MIYFIQEQQDPLGPVKIGYSRRINGRLTTIQTDNLRDLRLLRKIDGGKPQEKWLHSKFAHLRIKREWFNFDPSMLEVAPPADDAATPEADNLSTIAARDGHFTKTSARQFSHSLLRRSFPGSRSRAQDIANACGISRRTVENWLGGSGSPSLHHFLNACQALPEFARALSDLVRAAQRAKP